MAKINADNYYSLEADRAYFSASQIKSFLKCENETLAKLNGDYEQKPSQALTIGSYVDACFEGTDVEWLQAHPEVIKRDGTCKAEIQKGMNMYARARLDKTFMEYCSGETQRIFLGEIDGYPFKAKFDFYVPGERIVDVKTVRDMEPIYKEGYGRLSPIEYWNWTLQMAIYQELEGHKLPCYLAIITKEETPDLFLVQIDQSVMDAEMEMLKERLPRFDALKRGLIEPERCEKCDWCHISKKIEEPILFKYMEDDE